MKTKYELLKVVVGSHAHGLAGPDSDIDYRAVYLQPTEQILRLGFKYKGTHWIEGEAEDATAYELGHFLNLAMHCNPSILEVMLAPPAERPTELAGELRNLFPYIWEPKRCFDAFVGYGLNQRKKFLDKKDSRPHKYACAYVRVLYNLVELLKTGTFTVRVGDTPIGGILRRFKQKDYTYGEVIDVTEDLKKQAEDALMACKPKTQDVERVNKFLLKVRYEHFWEEG